MKKKIVFLFALACIMLLPLSHAIAEEGEAVPKKTTYVALTFDDGPHKTLTPKLLDLLEKYDAKATFFVIGENAAKYPDVMKRIAEDGHALGNHTYTHPNLKNVGSSKRKDEINKTQSLIEKSGYTGGKILRPPYGAMNDALKEWCADNGYAIIMWSVDTRDWESKNASKVSKSVMDESVGGDIVLMHDIHATTIDAMEIVLKTMPAKGYKFVTFPQLLKVYDKKLSDQATWRNAR